MLRCHCVDGLPIGEYATVPVEVGFEICGSLGDGGADDERQLHFIERLEIALGQHADIGSDHIGVPCRLWRAKKLMMIGTIVVGSAVLPQNSLSPKRIQSGPPQADDDLRVDAAFLGVADLA